MGTETYVCSVYHSPFKPKEVKLNNPQMGTETECTPLIDIVEIILEVKLNNPQMGTETVTLAFRFALLLQLSLN